MNTVCKEQKTKIMKKSNLDGGTSVGFTNLDISVKPIRTVKDLLKATVKDDATFANGGYDLFSEEIKKYLICKGGNLMLWEDWYKKPHPLISKTEDIEFELMELTQIENSKP